jgi:hypothetical protein
MASVIVRNKAKNRLSKILEQSYPIEPLLVGMKREYRGCILKKNFKLIYYYRPRRQEVVISTVWDMRMSPERLVKEFL